MEKVSIILPTYNSDSVLKNAIESVKYQTYENWELLIIENGKKGQAEEIIKKINDNRIKYIYQEVANVSESRNTGLNNASGEYIAFLDSDDKYGKDFLENMIKNISINKTQLVTCGYKRVYDKKQILIKQCKNIENTTKIKEYLETLKENNLFNELWNKIYISKKIKENNKIYKIVYTESNNLS